MGRMCLEAGADGLMVITPYGTSPSQEGIRDYYKALADALGQAVMLYDIPYLSGTVLEPETVAHIGEDKSIFAIKASNPDIAKFIMLMRLIDPKIRVMSGDEDLFALQVALGAVGGVLASTNIVPRTWTEIFSLASKGDLAGAQRKLAALSTFVRDVYSEPNPGPMKVALDLAGFDFGGCRTPIRRPKPELEERLRASVAQLLSYERSLQST